MLTIGQLGDRVALKPKTIRYYEEIGLLPLPARSESGYRLYGDADLRRLRFVTSARRAGFGLSEIRAMLASDGRGEPPCDLVVAAIRRRRAEVARLEAELEQLERRARRLGSPVSRSDDCVCRIVER